MRTATEFIYLVDVSEPLAMAGFDENQDREFLRSMEASSSSALELRLMHGQTRVSRDKNHKLLFSISLDF